MRPQDLLEHRRRRDDITGHRIVSFGRGRCEVRWEPPERIGNPAGFVHGGYVGVIVDEVSGLALMSLMDEVTAFPTASMHIDFLRGVTLGGAYTCRGTVLRVGRRLSVAECSVRDDDGRLLVRGSCAFAADFTGSDLVGFSAAGED